MVTRIPPLVAAVLWVLGVLTLLALPAPAQFEVDQKHLTVQAFLQPLDPFSEMNRAELPASGKMTFPRGGTFLLTLRLTPEKDWYTYPLVRRAPDQPEAQLGKLTLDGGDALQPLFPPQESPAEWKRYGEEVYLIHPQSFAVQQEIYIKPTAPEGQTVPLKIKLRVQVCSKICTWEDHELEVPVSIRAGAPEPVSPELQQRLAVKPSSPVVEPLPPSFQTVGAAKPSDSGKTPPRGSGPNTASEPLPATKVPKSLLGSILTAIIGGYVSLLTPCVFPMIPITVSYFLKQAEASKSATLAMAFVYSLTLVGVLTLGGLALMQVLVQISVHWATNFILAALFLFFALSLLGMYDITLPSWLQDLTSSGEGKGGVIGVFFMALTFSIVSFACVGPIYGGFISVEATSAAAPAKNPLHNFLPVFAFSAAFASPFFLLALFPTLLRSMPRAGSWMNSVKVVMGFLELAAVVKFLRAAELSYTQTSKMFTFDLSLGMYIALSLACGLYLLGLYRLPHDHDEAEYIGVPRLMFGLAFLTLGIYLVPGMFKAADGDAQRPRGTVFAWVESFLLPDTDSAAKPTSANGTNSTQLVWHSKLQDALSQAEREKKLVFVDFTGMLCTNCKLNERNVFTRPDVQAGLGKHVLLKLYTDFVPAGISQQPSAEEALKLRNEVFQTGALPLYALIRPKGNDFEILRKDEQGLIDDVPAFLRFLAE